MAETDKNQHAGSGTADGAVKPFGPNVKPSPSAMLAPVTTVPGELVVPVRTSAAEMIAVSL